MGKTRTTPKNSRHTSKADQRTTVTDDRLEPETVSDADAQELEATGRHVTALLRGEEIRIIPPAAWRQSWQRLLNAGQVDAFAEIVLHKDDYDLYLELDPTNEEFGEMVADAAERAGESLGKSRGPAASSRPTRRR